MAEKKIMLGNEAIARGAWEAGVTVSAAYPGTPSTEISESIVKYDEIYAEWSPNEKVAMEVAIGASMAGARALASMKHVGVNVAADPLYSISYIGSNGGLVIVAADLIHDSIPYCIDIRVDMFTDRSQRSLIIEQTLTVQIIDHFFILKIVEKKVIQFFMIIIQHDHDISDIWCDQLNCSCWGRCSKICNKIQQREVLFVTHSRHNESLRIIDAIDKSLIIETEEIFKGTAASGNDDRIIIHLIDQDQF